MKKILLFLVLGILLIGIVTGTIALSNYQKIGELKIISPEKLCEIERELKDSLDWKIKEDCDKLEDTDLNNSKLNFDILSDGKREIIKVYYDK